MSEYRIPMPEILDIKSRTQSLRIGMEIKQRNQHYYTYELILSMYICSTLGCWRRYVD